MYYIAKFNQYNISNGKKSIKGLTKEIIKNYEGTNPEGVKIAKELLTVEVMDEDQFLEMMGKKPNKAKIKSEKSNEKSEKQDKGGTPFLKPSSNPA